MKNRLICSLGALMLFAILAGCADTDRPSSSGSIAPSGSSAGSIGAGR